MILHKTNSWEQRELEKIIQPYVEKVPTPLNGYIRLGIRSHGKGTFSSYVEAGKELDVKEMYVVRKNNLIINITFAWEKALAITSEGDDGLLVSHRFPQFSFYSEEDPNFYKYIFLNEKFNKHLEICSPGGAGRNRVLSINKMFKYNLLTTKYLEQKKIASLIGSIEELITLHQRKPFPTS